jgi:hypothetical protein
VLSFAFYTISAGAANPDRSGAGRDACGVRQRLNLPLEGQLEFNEETHIGSLKVLNSKIQTILTLWQNQAGWMLVLMIRKSM